MYTIEPMIPTAMSQRSTRRKSMVPVACFNGRPRSASAWALVSALNPSGTEVGRRSVSSADAERLTGVGELLRVLEGDDRGRRTGEDRAPRVGADHLEGLAEVELVADVEPEALVDDHLARALASRPLVALGPSPPGSTPNTMTSLSPCGTRVMAIAATSPPPCDVGGHVVGREHLRVAERSRRRSWARPSPPRRTTSTLRLISELKPPLTPERIERDREHQAGGEDGDDEPPPPELQVTPPDVEHANSSAPRHGPNSAVEPLETTCAFRHICTSSACCAQATTIRATQARSIDRA